MRPFTIWRACGEWGMRLCVGWHFVVSILPVVVRSPLQTFETHFVCGFRPMPTTSWFFFSLLFLFTARSYGCVSWQNRLRSHRRHREPSLSERWDYSRRCGAITHHLTSHSVRAIKTWLGVARLVHFLFAVFFLQANCFSRQSWRRRRRNAYDV